MLWFVNHELLVFAMFYELWKISNFCHWFNWILGLRAWNCSIIIVIAKNMLYFLEFWMYDELDIGSLYLGSMPNPNLGLFFHWIQIPVIAYSPSLVHAPFCWDDGFDIIDVVSLYRTLDYISGVFKFLSDWNLYCM